MLTTETNLPISVVIPVYNEEEVIAELYGRLKATLDRISDRYEMIFVDDGSHDTSLKKIEGLSKTDENVKYVSFSRNFGHQLAVSAGLDACRGEAVVIIDADLQDPPELIIDMYDKYKEGYKIVLATRSKRKGETPFKKITAKLFYRLLKKITDIDIPLDTGDFRLIDQSVVDYLKSMPERNKFLRGQIAWLGFNQAEVHFERDERRFGKTKYSISKMLKFALDGITSFSNVPLQVVTRMGLLISLVSFMIIIYALVSHFILDKTIEGWTSLIISSAFIGGVQLFSLGILGEYIGRMNNNILDRPTYIIDKTNVDRG